MDQRPLPEDVTRAARTYLATLVPTGEVSDAWHELLEDVTYWKETARIPVLRLAHQVVLQHERVTPDVAALALTELGVTDPAEVATILDVDQSTAHDLLAHVAASEDVDLDRTPARGPARVGTTPDPVPPTTAEPMSDADLGPAPDLSSQPEPDSAATSSASGASPTAVRIGFDEEAAPDGGRMPGERTSSWWTTRRLLVVAVVVWILILLVWALGGTR